MITNERRYRHARTMLQRFQAQLQFAESAPPSDGVHPDVHGAMLDGLRSQIAVLETHIADYERLRATQAAIEVRSLAELPTALIKARIARGWNQRQLSERVGLKEQQVQRYEAQRYKGVAIERLHEIASVLGVQVRMRLELIPTSGGTAVDNADVSQWRRALLALLVGTVQEDTGQPIRGRLALQKWLIRWNDLVGQRLGFLVFGHAPLHFGGFDDEVANDIELLKSRGVLRVSGNSDRVSDSDGALFDRVARRVRTHRQDETFELTRAGLIWLREFLVSPELADGRIKAEIATLAHRLAKQTGDASAARLIEDSYERFPLLAEKSRIKEKVIARVKKRRALG